MPARRFGWGVSIDDPWTYAGMAPPKSELIPYALSLRMPRGPVEVLEHPSMGQAVEEAVRLDEQPTPGEVETLCADLASRLKGAGLNIVRCWFPWDFFDPGAGSDATFVMDPLVRSLVSAGLEVFAVLGNGYSRFIPPGVSLEHLSKYAGRLAAASEVIVRHYARDVKLWQIENEPNWWEEHLAARWRHGLIWLEPSAQGLLLGTLRDVVRRECPGGRIVVNIEADRRKADWKFYSSFCDVIGLDLYPGYAHPHRTSAEGVSLANEAKRESGLPVMIAETGYPSGPRILGYSEERQAEYIRSACEESYACDAVDALCVWRYSDSYWRSFPMQENHFGLLDKKREPKPAWGEYSRQIAARR